MRSSIRPIGIDQHDCKAFLLERLAGLRAGVIEFAGLANDNRAGADDEDFVNVSSFGHVRSKGTANRMKKMSLGVSVAQGGSRGSPVHQTYADP